MDRGTCSSEEEDDDVFFGPPSASEMQSRSNRRNTLVELPETVKRATERVRSKVVIPAARESPPPSPGCPHEGVSGFAVKWHNEAMRELRSAALLELEEDKENWRPPAVKSMVRIPPRAVVDPLSAQAESVDPVAPQCVESCVLGSLAVAVDDVPKGQRAVLVDGFVVGNGGNELFASGVARRMLRVQKKVVHQIAQLLEEEEDCFVPTIQVRSKIVAPPYFCAFATKDEEEVRCSLVATQCWKEEEFETSKVDAPSEDSSSSRLDRMNSLLSQRVQIFQGQSKFVFDHHALVLNQDLFKYLNSSQLERIRQLQIKVL